MPDDNQSTITTPRRTLAIWICCIAAAFSACICFPALCQANLTTVADLSGHGHTGTLGTGFSQATSPTLTGSYAVFSGFTNTISLAGNVSLSNQATYEVTVLLTSTTYTTYGNGMIWNDFEQNVQDNQFDVMTNGSSGELSAFAYPVKNPTTLNAGTLQTGVWYDLAYVYDGSQERLYVNGTLVGSRAASGSIGIGSGNDMAIGANERNGGTFVNNFDGDLASLRVSNTARYSGSSYNAVSGPGDFSDDASTQLLFDFAPVPEPTSVAMLMVLGAAGLMRRRRKA